MLASVSDHERQEILTYFFERFGIPSQAFEGIRLLHRAGTIWAVAFAPELNEILEKLKIQAAGIPLLRVNTPKWKPTTFGLQVFGRHARKNVADLDDEEVGPFLRGQTIRRTFPTEPGYVIVRWQGHLLGCGLSNVKGELRSQIPSNLRAPLRAEAGEVLDEQQTNRSNG